MTAAASHYDKWHDDNIENRVIGMSINLSTEPYSGGLFQLRLRESGRILTEIANIGRGDALLFKISANLQHRVSDIEGDKSKTAFAGWFLSNSPQLFDEIRASHTGPTRSL
jgi:hypothetical protein